LFIYLSQIFFINPSLSSVGRCRSTGCIFERDDKQRSGRIAEDLVDPPFSRLVLDRELSRREASAETPRHARSFAFWRWSSASGPLRTFTTHRERVSP